MSKEQNGKTNGKAKEEQIIPQNVWKAFYEYWDATEFKDLTKKDIQKHLGNGKYVFVPIPKNVTDKTIGKAWYDQISQFREKGKGGFGGYTVCFKNQKATLEEVFSDKPLNPATMVKILHFYINDHSLSSKKSEPKAEAKTEEKNGKKTVKVNSIEAMEQVVEKIKPKKGK